MVAVGPAGLVLVLMLLVALAALRVVLAVLRVALAVLLVSVLLTMLVVAAAVVAVVAVVLPVLGLDRLCSQLQALHGPQSPPLVSARHQVTPRLGAPVGSCRALCRLLPRAHPPAVLAPSPSAAPPPIGPPLGPWALGPAPPPLVSLCLPTPRPGGGDPGPRRTRALWVTSPPTGFLSWVGAPVWGCVCILAPAPGRD